MIKLIGILIVAVGFALRFNTLLVVMAAGIGTGLVAGLSFNEIMELFGRFFVENRYVTLPVLLMLPVVGLLERYGLRERAEILIQRAKAATEVTSEMLKDGSWRSTQFKAYNFAPELPEATVQAIRANASAAENVGNFFGEDTVFAVSAVYLIKGVLESQGQKVGVWALSLWGIPTAVVAFAAVWWRTRVLDRRIARDAQAVAKEEAAS